VEFERQGFGALVEGRDRDAVANTSWIQRSDIGSGTISRLPESTRRSWTVARTQHDAVFAERHRVGVAIFGLCDSSARGGIVEAIIVLWSSLIYTDPAYPKSVCCFDRQQLRKNDFGTAPATLHYSLESADVPPVSDKMPAGRSPFLLICDHYGRTIPQASAISGCRRAS